MNYLLVVDDSPVDRQLVRSLLELHLNYRIEFASNGWEALEHIESQLPLVVITDLLMPEMDGLKLTETIHRLYKSVPVILMTAHGSEEIAAEALLRGAADYIPKSKLAKELHFAVRGVLELSEGISSDRRLGHFLKYEQTRFELENDMRLIGPLVDHL
jgi:CheY-like chemotaxis protein